MMTMTMTTIRECLFDHQPIWPDDQVRFPAMGHTDGAACRNNLEKRNVRVRQRTAMVFDEVDQVLHAFELEWA